MNTLGITQSVCKECRKVIPAKVVDRDNTVYMNKFCSEHGTQEVMIHTDTKEYQRTKRFVKPAWIPRTFNGDSNKPCPEGCGFCDRHEQHLCMPIVEITSRCDLDCPVCITSAGKPWDLSAVEFDTILNSLCESERQIDVLNISGGEPLLHPQLIELIDAAVARPEIVRVSISTNGLRLLHDHNLVTELAKRNVVISLQFDGFDDSTYITLRGIPLIKKKEKLLELLDERGIPTSITMTVAGGVNDHELGAVADLLFSSENIISLMLQPVAFAGRAGSMTDTIERLSIHDVVNKLDKSSLSYVTKDDFTPLPCSHPSCFSLAFYLVPDKGVPVSMAQLIDADIMLDAIANRVFFGLDAEEHERIKELIYSLWSGPVGSVPESKTILKTLKTILNEMSCSSFDPRRAFAQAEKRVKSIFIHAFQDVDTFDLSRVRRCCQAYPQPDGSLIPACVHNVLRRG